MYFVIFMLYHRHSLTEHRNIQYESRTKLNVAHLFISNSLSIEIVLSYHFNAICFLHRFLSFRFVLNKNSSSHTHMSARARGSKHLFRIPVWHIDLSTRTKDALACAYIEIWADCLFVSLYEWKGVHCTVKLNDFDRAYKLERQRGKEKRTDSSVKWNKKRTKKNHK